MDEVLRRSLLYGIGTTALLTPSLYTAVQGRTGKWIRYMKRPIEVPPRKCVDMLSCAWKPSKGLLPFLAYRTISKKYHPDKVAAVESTGSGSPKRPPGFEDMSNEDFFIEIKKAQEILMSDVRKSNYDRFGDFKLGLPISCSLENVYGARMYVFASMYRELWKIMSAGDIDEKGTIIVVCLTVVAHLLCFCVGYIVSYPKHVTFARQVFLVFNLALLCNELQIRFVEDGDSLGLFPYVSRMPPFERIHFFRNLFPFVLCGSLCIATWQFSDQPAKRMALLKAILSTNRVLTERTQELIRVTAYLKSGGTPSIAALKLQQQEARQEHAALIRAKLFDGSAKETSGGSSGVSHKSSHSSRKSSDVSSPRPIISPATDSASVGSGTQDDTKNKGKKESTDWSDFANTLNDEQRELFRNIVAEQYRRAEADDRAKEKAKARFDINWGQLLMWVCVLYLWIYYK